MPMSKAFQERLFQKLPEIIGYFGTPFHIMDEQGIIDTGQGLKKKGDTSGCVAAGMNPGNDDAAVTLAANLAFYFKHLLDYVGLTNRSMIDLYAVHCCHIINGAAGAEIYDYGATANL